MNINYNKKLSLFNRKDTRWCLESDKGSLFEISETDGTWFEWWNKQHQSDLRLWQKDIFREFANAVVPSLRPCLVYRSNQGYNQPHDVAISHAPDEQVWILSTENDFWIIDSNYGEIIINVADSLGSILDETFRKQTIYPLLDLRRKETTQ